MIPLIHGLFFDVRTAPEAFSALVVRIVFYKARALGMAFALVIKPLLGTPEFMGDLVRRNIVIRRRRRDREGLAAVERKILAAPTTANLSQIFSVTSSARVLSSSGVTVRIEWFRIIGYPPRHVGFADKA